jgi:RNA polymerase sigma-70 factor (ECF subfamily)
VVLRYSQGLSLEEVAEITGQPMGTVKTHLHRARAALAKQLAEPGAEIEPAAGLGAEASAPRTGS